MDRVRIRGDRLRDFRETRGLSQAALGEKVGVKQRTISDYENDEKFAVPGDVFTFLCAVLDCSPYYLLGLVEHPNPERTLTPEWLAFVTDARAEGFSPADCRRGLDLLRLARGMT